MDPTGLTKETMEAARTIREQEAPFEHTDVRKHSTDGFPLNGTQKQAKRKAAKAEAAKAKQAKIEAEKKAVAEDRTRTETMEKDQVAPAIAGSPKMYDGWGWADPQVKFTGDPIMAPQGRDNTNVDTGWSFFGIAGGVTTDPDGTNRNYVMYGLITPGANQSYGSGNVVPGEYLSIQACFILGGGLDIPFNRDEGRLIFKDSTASFSFGTPTFTLAAKEIY